jgi:hypothetical protein
LTSEVVAINPDAVVLAADSALTLAAPNGSTKVYPGFTKIYQTSQTPPLACMIYGMPRLAGLPWDTLLQMYQGTQPDMSTVVDYANGFDRWLDTPGVLPQAGREKAWMLVLQGVVERCLTDAIVDTQTTLSFNARVRASAFALRKRIQAAPLLRDVPAFDLAAQVERNKAEYDRILGRLLWGREAIEERTRHLLHEVLAECTYHDLPATNASGVVFAGVGLEEAVPSYAVINYTFERGTTRRSTVDRRAAGDGKAPLEPFGQSDEVKSFLDGVHPRMRETMEQVWHEFTTELAQLAPGVAQGCIRELMGAAPFELTAEQNEELSSRFREAMLSLWHVYESALLTRAVPASLDQFREPVAQTVPTVPRQTLVQVAEDLVRLTITRQRVSADDAETVGGDIDVAVISRSEGFVWARRRVEA